MTEMELIKLVRQFADKCMKCKPIIKPCSCGKCDDWCPYYLVHCSNCDGVWDVVNSKKRWGKYSYCPGCGYKVRGGGGGT